MNPGLAESASIVEELFGASPVLQSLGFATSTRELQDETDLLPATCRFTFETAKFRILLINFCWHWTGEHSFTIEITNTATDDAFLLQDWMSQVGISLEPYPFVLTSYSGSLHDRLVGFLKFLEQQLRSDPILNVLKGNAWLKVLFDWGSMR